MLALIRRWWVLILWVVALLISVSRLYVGVHWPSDLLVGWVIGAVTVLVVHRVYIGITSWNRHRLRRTHC